jgi:CheY-like chemotaxis protein
VTCGATLGLERVVRGFFAGAATTGAASAATSGFALAGADFLRVAVFFAALAGRLEGESDFFDFIIAGARGGQPPLAHYCRRKRASQPENKLLAKHIDSRFNDIELLVDEFMSQTNAAQTAKESGAKTLIFVVDDSPMLVEFAAMVLQSAGYEVKTFTEPGPALKALSEGGLRPALMVTDYDMGMRAMNGLDLIVNCHKVHPTMRIVLASGTVDGSVTLHHAAKVDRFLSKPYQPAQLKSLAAELLK